MGWKSNRIPHWAATAAALGSLLLVATAAAPRPAAAQTVKPRFLILVDTSGSMAQNATGTSTHGDGSREHPGCDLDANTRFDDSKMFQAKAALNDTLAAFGSVEFGLARYRQAELGQACGTASQCTVMGFGANVCVGGRCGFSIGSNSPDYNECRVGTGCVRCADPDNDPVHVFYNGSTCCLAGEPTAGGFGLAGDVVVPFPAAGSNLPQLISWIDGQEDFPTGTNKELRASGTTPIGGALNAVRDWMVNDNSTVGPGAGILNRDDRSACRSYNVILITDGLEVNQCVTNCRISAAQAADRLFHSCTNDGVWDRADGRCEIGGEPFGTREVRVRTYVVGFTVDDPALNAMAAAGGTGSALLANNQAELTARLGDIVAGSIPTERCDCQDNTCDGEVDETFRAKGDTCTRGHRPLQARRAARLQRRRQRPDLLGDGGGHLPGRAPGPGDGAVRGLRGGTRLPGPHRRGLRRRRLRRPDRREHVLRLRRQARGVQRPGRRLQRPGGRRRPGALWAGHRRVPARPDRLHRRRRRRPHHLHRRDPAGHRAVRRQGQRLRRPDRRLRPGLFPRRRRRLQPGGRRGQLRGSTPRSLDLPGRLPHRRGHLHAAGSAGAARARWPPAPNWPATAWTTTATARSTRASGWATPAGRAMSLPARGPAPRACRCAWTACSAAWAGWDRPTRAATPSTTTATAPWTTCPAPAGSSGASAARAAGAATPA